MTKQKLALLLLFLVFQTSCGMIQDYRENLAQGTRLASNGGGSGASPRLTATLPATPTLTPVPTSSLGIQPDRLRGVVVAFWHPWSGAAAQVITGQVEAFNRTNPWGIQVLPRALGGFDPLDEAIQAGLQSGDLPDLTVAYLYQAQAWESGGTSLLDLDPYVRDVDWGLDEQSQGDFYPVYWEHDRVDGRRLGIPAQGSGKVLYYNATWARELGFDTPPSTPPAFRQQACAAAQAALRDNELKNDHKGGWIVSTDYTPVLGWIYAFGGDVLTAGGTQYTFDTPEATQAFTFLRDLLDRGCAWLSESQGPEAEFASRMGLFATGSVSGIPQQEEAFVTAGSQDEWAALPFPASEGEGVMPVYGASFQVFQASPEEELASWLLVKYLTDPQQQAELAQVSSQFPVRASSLNLMGVLPAAHPQWKAALELIPHARHEPALPSWRLVRWAVSDAATQLFRYYFEVGQVSTLVRLLNTTANDLNEE